MKNIGEILTAIGITIPKDKVDEFKKVFNENYKTVNEVDTLQTKLNNALEANKTLESTYTTKLQDMSKDVDTLKKQLETAGTDEAKLKDLETKFDTLKTQYDTATKDYENNLKRQKYEFAVKEEANKLKFTSNSAKTAFISDVLSRNLSMEDDKIIGFGDVVESYKTNDAGAFVVENNEDNSNKSKDKPQFSGKTNNQDNMDNKNQSTDKKTLPLIW